MKFYVLESGSKGNATLIENEGRFLLIDMGTALCVVKNELSELNHNIYDVDALLLTHNHSDHTKGVRYLPPLPIYCTKDTYDSSTVENIEPYKSFNIIGLKITPVSTSHDAPNPVGFIIESENEKMVYLTDTGYIPEETLKYMHNADYYVIESNHNLKKLYQTDRPQSLKLRIAGEHGHLSNEDSACYMVDLVGENTKEIVLAHISEEANTHELALQAFTKKFKKYHLDLNKIDIKCAFQNKTVSGGDK